ncbi:(2Fe-2S)-binding protein [Streptomyces sp. YC504]|uniref:(2Fe-2S)-binding protein n=1 Tax=Streptomyces mesophilus TaxID=1775132 RepID=A0A6G4XJD5_9ACTN|nr:2Fe-2S iron-sulfur cluster-binding protein [Streptomyces mesophilus]NGO76741.1 (2Fe-2S)-binding protein [Streptomyces mesophilus]
MSGTEGNGAPGYGDGSPGYGDGYGSGGQVSNGQQGEGSYVNDVNGSYGNDVNGSYGNDANGSYGHGGWQPTSQGEYDGDATAFVALPEGFADAPLAAPGGSFVPPQISVVPGAAADPAATGTFVIPALVPQMGPEPAAAAQSEPAPAPVQWPEPNAPQEPAPQHEAGMTGQWSFTEAAAQAAPEPGLPQVTGPSQVTGQWSIPLAQGDLPDESGEFTSSSLVDQWADRAPATLPGGAAAPWAQAVPQDAPQPAPQPAPRDASQNGEPAAPVEPAAPEAAPAAQQPAEADVPQQDAQQDAPPEPAADEPSAQDAAEAAPDGDGQPDGSEPAAPVSAFGDEHPLSSYVLRVNGADRPVTDAWIGESLLYVLRERLGLAGAKDGCSQGECGACAVQVDGRLVASCLVPAATAAGSEVRTVEGLADEGQPSDVQRALAASCAVQCGFCVPGMAMTVHDLLEGNPQPSEREARQALCGNLCRCSGYKGVLEAVKDVVAERQSAVPEDETDDQARIPHQAPPGAGGVTYSQGGGRA